MNILVTGASGFIGSWIVKAILEKHCGHIVYLVDRVALPLSDWGEYAQNIKIVQIDLENHYELELAMRKADVCIHCVSGGGENPFERVKNDNLLSALLLTLAVKFNHVKFVYLSSVASVGRRSPFMDESVCLNPISLYSSVKAANEAYIQGWAHERELHSVIIRPGYTYGMNATLHSPKQSAQQFYSMIRSIKKSERLVFAKNSGAQFVSVKDVADACVNSIAIESRFEIFHVVGKKYISWYELAKQIVELTGSRAVVVESEDLPIVEPNYFSTAHSEKYLGIDLDQTEKLYSYLSKLTNCMARIDLI